MKKSITLCLLFFTIMPGWSQQLDWANAFGNTTAPTYTYDMTLDPGGNVIVAGNFAGTIDLDPGPGNALFTSVNSYRNLFLAKYDANGNYIWAFSIESVSNYWTRLAVDVDSAGNIVLSGPLNGTSVDLDPGPGTHLLSSNGIADVFVAMYNSSGAFIHAASFGGGFNDLVNDVVFDNNGNIFVTGAFEGALVIFGPGDTLFNNGYPNYDLLLVKFDPAGNFLWARSTGGSGNDYGIAMAIAGNGDVILAGSYTNDSVDMDFGPGIDTLPRTNYGGGLLARYDTNGNHIWAFGITAPSASVAFRALATDSTGNCYLAGGFGGTPDFNPGPAVDSIHGIASATNTFIASYDGGGNYLGTITTGEGQGECICADDAGNIIVGGWFSATSDFDPGATVANLTNQGPFDVFVAKYTVALNYQDAFSVGAFNGYSTTTTGAEDSNGNFFISGYFNGNNFDFDPGAANVSLSAGNNEYSFIAKYSMLPAGMTEWNDYSGFSIFPNPVSNGSIRIVSENSSLGLQGKITVYDALGNTVLTQNTNEQKEITIETADWLAGIYLITIYRDGQRYMKKVIVL